MPYACDSDIIDLAKTLVPQIEAKAGGAESGTVTILFSLSNDLIIII